MREPFARDVLEKMWSICQLSASTSGLDKFVSHKSAWRVDWEKGGSIIRTQPTQVTFTPLLSSALFTCVCVYLSLYYYNWNRSTYLNKQHQQKTPHTQPIIQWLPFTMTIIPWRSLVSFFLIYDFNLVKHGHSMCFFISDYYAPGEEMMEGMAMQDEDIT